MMMFPLIEIIFYIAVLFAPMNTTQIIISHEGSPVITYSQTDDGWKSSANHTLWKVNELKVKHAENSIDVSEFVKGASTHKWSDQSILKLSGNMEILKMSDGYWIYPNGIDSPKEKWIIKYKTDAKK